MELKDRKRSFDINKLSADQVDNLSEQIGAKVREICDEAAGRVNALLAIYGMTAKIAIAFDKLGQPKQDAPKKKRGRPKKQTQDNLNT